MSYDHELILISHMIGQDNIGNSIPIETIETSILCRLNSVGRSEFYNAAVAGLRPEIVFTIHNYEYSGQKQLRFEGILYSVIRTYATSFEELELTCERVAGHG